MMFTKDDLEAALDQAGLEQDVLHFDYSGRGMFGARCPAIYVKNAGEVAAFFVGLVSALMERDQGDDIYDIVDMAKSTQTDSMGYDIVAYWPRLEVRE